MKYTLTGHDLRHAVEEMLYHLLPTAEVEQIEDTTLQNDVLHSSLRQENQTIYAKSVYYIDDKCYESEREACVAGLDQIAHKRSQTELVKLSAFDVVTQAMEKPPEWGALTGVRPAKLARLLIERGQSRGEAAEMFRSRYHVSPARTALSFRAAAYAQQVLDSLDTREVSLYVGIPFCPSRCAYCSFVSSSIARSAHLIAPYVQALCDEIEDTAKLLHEQDRQITSIYIGGGTPTTLSAEQLTQLMGHIQDKMNLSALREYTVEAGRPDTITYDKLVAIKQGGAGRISINPQTMNDAVLASIGRKHSAQAVLDCYAMAQEIGFDSINMDLIAGLAGETVDSFSRTLDILLAQHPHNITIHSLAIKRGADLTDKAENVAQHLRVAQMLDEAAVRLPQAGYAPYYLYRQKFSAGGFENVGWCLPNKESVYNVTMMEELQSIVSCGAGGVSKRVNLQNGKIARFTAPKYPTEYLTARQRIDMGKRRLFSGEEE